MDKLQQLIALCKCGVHISINEHRNYYETVKQYVLDDQKEDVDPDIWDKMVETNTVVNIQAYPNTPVGFFSVLHYDLGQALSLMIRSIEGDKEEMV